jgi:hypothetical protein
MLNYLLAILVTGIFLPSAFAIESDNNDNQIAIMVNQTKTWDTLKITLLEIAEDSRCPLDVTCVWQGQASVKLHIEDQKKSEEIVLNDDKSINLQIAPLEIKLVDLFPYPVSTETITPEKYIATIEIVKNSESIAPPLKQFKAGTNIKDVKCKSDLILIQKIDKTPACVKEQTKEKLIERAWGQEI